MTPTQFAARALDISDFPPPQPKRGTRYGLSVRCWLCGGETDGVGWPQSVAIAPTFTQHNCAKMQDSDAVCQSCAALTRAETFQAMVKARGLPVKTWTQCGWHSYSHYIREDGHYEAPIPARVREILNDPPEGKWLLCINTSGQKHTIFRGTVATGRDRFPVQVDEETVWTGREEVGRCISDFERLATLGFGRDEIATGNYNPTNTLRAGIRAWREADEPMRIWREARPDLVALAAIAARSRKTLAEVPPPETASPVVIPAPLPTPTYDTPSQMSLF